MSRSFAAKQNGTSLIEVLVSMVVSVIGLLGMIKLQMHSFSTESESFQRANAAVLLQDMVSRINANYVGAAGYVANDIGVGDLQDCSGAAVGAARDLCNWGNLLRGAQETVGYGSRVGAMASARACITSPEANVYIVAIVWEGVVATGAPTTVCGKDKYSSEAVRRAVTAVTRIADLNV